MNNLSDGDHNFPFLSVVIPTRNRERQLQCCLESLAQQDYPNSRWEVIVVSDGGSPIDTSPWIERMNIKAICQSHAGCGMARNKGGWNALGAFLIFTDDDCLLPHNWLRQFSEYFRLFPDCLIGGCSKNELPDDMYAQGTQDILDYLLATLNSDPEDARLAIGGNFGVAAAAFYQMGGFAPRYFRTTAEERDFCFRWRQSGRRIIYSPNIVVGHAHALTFVSFLKQHFHYGRGAWIFHSSQSNSSTGPGLEDARFYCSLLLSPFRIYSGKRAWTSFLILLLSQAAQLAGYLAARSPRAADPLSERTREA